MRTLLLGLFLAASAIGQTPDCQFTGTINTSVTTVPTTTPFAFNNKTTRCAVWVFTYYTNSAASVSVTLQGAPDVAGSPGSYTAMTASLVTTNPATGTAAGIVAACCDYYPWIQVSAGTFTGSSRQMFVTVLGWKDPGALGSTGGGATSNVNVQEWNGTTAGEGGTAGYPGIGGIVASAGTNSGVKPVKIGGPFNTTQPTVTNGQIVDAQFSARGSQLVTPGVEGFPNVSGVAAIGATPSGNPLLNGWRDSAGVIVPEYCTSKANITSLSSGNTQLVPVSGSTKIRVCEVFYSGDTLSTYQLVTGTGSTCTSSVAETGVFSGAGSGLFGIDIAPPNGVLETTAAKTLCIAASAGSTGGGYILYSQR